MKHIGKNIRQLRHRKTWSQSQVAQQLNISIPAFSKIETGLTDINITRLHQIATLFDVPITTILLKEGENPQSANIQELSTLKTKLQKTEEDIIQLQKKLIDLYEEVR